MYLREGRHTASEEAGRGLAARALGELERAAALSETEAGRGYHLKGLAEAALAAADTEKARDFAERLLTTADTAGADEAGLAVHHGNLVLGHLAVRAGDVGAAVRHLLAAAQTAGSAPLCSFGPNMALARELLARGERAAVLEYLRLCGRFWQPADGRLDRWTQTVDRGGVPNFGANLFY